MTRQALILLSVNEVQSFDIWTRLTINLSANDFLFLKSFIQLHL
jgi:hypothetical protein